MGFKKKRRLTEGKELREKKSANATPQGRRNLVAKWL